MPTVYCYSPFINDIDKLSARKEIRVLHVTF